MREWLKKIDLWLKLVERDLEGDPQGHAFERLRVLERQVAALRSLGCADDAHGAAPGESGSEQGPAREWLGAVGPPGLAGVPLLAGLAHGLETFLTGLVAHVSVRLEFGHGGS